MQIMKLILILNIWNNIWTLEIDLQNYSSEIAKVYLASTELKLFCWNGKYHQFIESRCILSVKKKNTEIKYLKQQQKKYFTSSLVFGSLYKYTKYLLL